MYKFADVTYPLLVATQADYSLFYATGVVTFRFEFIDPKSRVISADLFRFTALYKSRDRAYLSDRLGFVASKKSVERAVIDGRMSIVYPRKDRERTGLLDLYAFGVKTGLRDRPPVKDALSFRVSFPRVSGVGSVDVFEFRLTTRQLHHTVAVDSFFIKNPHSRSFLLGDTSPENTALGGQGYA